VEGRKKQKREDIQHRYDQEEKDYHYFTKCEYYTRYTGTSHFAMDNCEYWGTYFRSTGLGGESGRFTRKDIKSKTFKNKSLNIEEGGSYHSRTGTFRNPYELKEYRKSVEKPEKFKKVASEQDLGLIENTQGLNLENPLYEELLDYRNQICLQVFNKALELLPHNEERFELIHHNEYPCLIVKIPFIQHFEYTESWNKLFIAYYVAIVNKEAEVAGIPIEMVIRSGFGHLLPSIDVTGTSFRINVGVVPACYGEIIAKSLATLQDIITNSDRLNTTLERYKYKKGKNFIEKINDKIEVYNNSRPTDNVLPIWKKKQKCYEILQLQGDPSGKSVVCQITRKRMYLDLLADYVANELDNEAPDLTRPIVRMLSHLDFGTSISTNIDQSSFKRNSREWPAQENLLLQKDEQFWKTITRTVKSIGGGMGIYDNRTLHGLYSKLEKANKEFIIRSASTIAAEDGLGSDSEEEAEGPKKQRLYTKKLTITTGMMAINVAHYLARYYLKQYLGIEQYRAECKSMYYETEKSLKLSAKGKEKLAVLNNKKPSNPSILFFDLNHCDVSGAQSTRLRHYIEGDLAGKNIPIMVMDYSSSTTSHIKCAINDAINAGVKLILLVSSGLKNEQLSADNPYGTVRIITLDKAQREKLYKEATKVLKENGGIPATAHKLRKGYKKVGLIPTNQQILNADTNRKPFEEQAAIIVNQLYKNPYEIERYKRVLLEQIDNLFKRPIRITKQQRELIGEARARELEEETVIGQVENTLREMIVDELKPFVEENMEQAIEMDYRQAERQNEQEQEEYEQRMQDYNEGYFEGWDYGGPVKPESPSWVSREEIREKYEDAYGDLNDLLNLIKLSQIEDNVLSQIIYDNFITIDGMDAILEALEYNTLNLDSKLVRRILNNCDVQFYDVAPTQNGFLTKYLKESIEERFARIAIAYPGGRDEQGRTPLHIAAENGKFKEIDRLLLDKGTDINAQDKYGDTPLHAASEKGHLKVIELLVSKGASIIPRNSLDNTPLDEAILYGNLEACNLLLELGASVYDSKALNHSLQTATTQGQVQVVNSIINLIVNKGININAQDDKGNTLLHIAYLNAHVEVLKILMEKGADTNVKNEKGNTPLHVATDSILCSSYRCPGYVEVCKLLIQNGTKLDAQNNQGLTPIELAKRNNTELYELLIQQLM
jgi:ankyrin repeat protein